MAFVGYYLGISKNQCSIHNSNFGKTSDNRNNRIFARGALDVSITSKRKRKKK